MEDTASIVEQAVADATTTEANEPIPGDETPEAPADAAETASETPTEEPSQAPAPVAEAPKKKRGPIPYDRHEAVLTKARNEAKAAQEALQKQVEEYKGRYESDEIKNQLAWLNLLGTDPKKAVEILRQAAPDRFSNLTWAEQQAAAAQAAEQAAPAPAAAEMPQPDALLPDGTLGYSAEGAQKLLDWRMAQERAAFQQELKVLRDEVKPITVEHKARAAFDQSVQKMRPVLENARKTWDGFTENEAEIRQKLAENQTWSLDDAYRAVVVPKLKTNRDTIHAEERKRILDEMNQRGKAKGVLPGQAPAAAAGAADKTERTTADIVRAAIQAAA